MILAIGTDIIRINRFKKWQSFPNKKLTRVFSAEEIAYCLSSNDYAAARLAVRFAARESFYKAFCCAFKTETQVQFHTILQMIHTKKAVNGAIELIVNWSKLTTLFHIKDLPYLHVSCSHDGNYALATVILEQR